jgi:hypothetical protein
MQEEGAAQNEGETPAPEETPVVKEVIKKEVDFTASFQLIIHIISQFLEGRYLPLR